MKTIIVILFISLLTGCGGINRFSAFATGVAETCHDGVTYLQFASGATVKYNKDGTIAQCVN